MNARLYWVGWSSWGGKVSPSFEACLVSWSNFCGKVLPRFDAVELYNYYFRVDYFSKSLRDFLVDSVLYTRLAVLRPPAIHRVGSARTAILSDIHIRRCRHLLVGTRLRLFFAVFIPFVAKTLRSSNFSSVGRFLRRTSSAWLEPTVVFRHDSWELNNQVYCVVVTLSDYLIFVFSSRVVILWCNVSLT